MQTLLENIDTLVFNGGGATDARKHIRAAFHDCTQGCDARIGLDNTDNRGLEAFVQRMDRIYYNRTNSIFRDALSRPDFWVLCSRRALASAIHAGAASSGSFPSLGSTFSVFNYGRPNNTEASDRDNN
jgi:hypothetical protein